MAVPLDRARQAFDAAQSALAKGDWTAFGQAMERLSETLGHAPIPLADDGAAGDGARRP